MGRAMQNVAERVEEAKDNQELLKQYKERMRGVVPEQIKSVLSDVVGGGGGSDANKTSTEEWSRLLQQTADNLDALSQTTQKVMGYANVEQRDADMATQTLNQVSQGLEDLKESLNA
jgi:ABC-type transporter Mla subunit MlaD